MEETQLQHDLQVAEDMLRGNMSISPIPFKNNRFREMFLEAIERDDLEDNFSKTTYRGPKDKLF